MLIGRDREADQLRERLGGDHGVVAVTGVAGIGKTAMLREVIEADAVWLQSLATAQARPGVPLALSLASVSGAPERDASNLLHHLGGRRLVLDDAHWLDRYTLAVVELVATATRLVATWRTADPSSLSPPPAQWELLVLGPLGAPDARALACCSCPSLSPPELAQVLDVADGSPLLIQELASSPSLGPSAASALLGRFQELSPAGRRAVILIAASEAGLEETHVEPAVREELRHSGLVVRTDGRCSMRHALLQDSVLDMAGTALLSDAHGRLADLLASAEPAAAARHAERAGRHDAAVALAQRAVAAAEDSLDRARGELALADLLDAERPEGAWKHRVAATSEMRERGAFHEVVAALGERALPTGDPELFGMACVNLGGACWALGDHEHARLNAERGLSAVTGTGGEAELLLRAGLAMYHARIRFDGVAALDHAQAALAIAEARCQHVIFARTRIAAALLTTGDPDWRPVIDGAVDDAVATGDHDGERLAREARHVHAFVTGDLATALTDLEMLTEETRSADLTPSHRALRLLLELMTLRDRGSVVAGAERLLGAAAFFPQRALAVAAGAVAAIDHGRADIAHRLLRPDDPADPEDLAVIRWARAELAWATGGRASTAERADATAPILDLHPGTTMHAVMTAWCALESGDAIPDGPIMTLPGFAAAIREVEAIRVLARGDARAAGELFDEAAGLWTTGSDRRGVLRCRWGAASAADRRSAADAVARLEQCWSEATALGSAPVATRAAQALRLRNVARPPFPSPALPPLSGPQAQTVRLLATGFTTQQVATLLGLQSGTIDDHLHQAQDRLGLRTRVDALRWIAERP